MVTHSIETLAHAPVVWYEQLHNVQKTVEKEDLASYLLQNTPMLHARPLRETNASRGHLGLLLDDAGLLHGIHSPA